MKLNLLMASLVLGGLWSAQAPAADPLDVDEIEQTANSFAASNAPASTSSYEDEIMMAQVGAANFARADQFASAGASAAITQTGNDNAAGVFQANGVNNSVLVNQLGNSNYLSVTQTGDNNTATFNQVNDFNRFSLNQSGGDNNATVTQTGNSGMTLNQTGSQTADISLQGTTQGTVTQMSPTLYLNISN
jgi:hypothetical protein